MKKIKIINTNGIKGKEFEQKIKLLVRKGWRIKGSLVACQESLYLLLYK